jgi:hypothetical protein
MDRDELSERVEHLIEKVNGLDVAFGSSAKRQEAEQLIESAADSLESYLDLLEDEEGDEPE